LLVVALTALDVWRAWRSGRAANLGWLFVTVSFVGVLAPQTWSEYRTRTGPPPSSAAHYQRLLKSSDARVRALVMEAIGYSPRPNAEVATVLRAGLDDADPLVREMARQALAHRVGHELTEADARAAAKGLATAPP
jgi:hypothetical protein